MLGRVVLSGVLDAPIVVVPYEALGDIRQVREAVEVILELFKPGILGDELDKLHITDEHDDRIVGVPLVESFEIL